MPTAAPGPGTNDLDLVETVIGLAMEPGYVLIGEREQVWRRRVHRGVEVVAAGADEVLAVRQLLAAAVLTRGGSRLVEHRSGQTSAVSVLARHDPGHGPALGELPPPHQLGPHPAGKEPAVNRPSDPRWRDEATCRQVDAEAFFPEAGANPNPARRVCAVCPVRVECLTDALNRRDIAYGVLGGLTPRERRELLRHQTTTTAQAEPIRSAA